MVLMPLVMAAANQLMTVPKEVCGKADITETNADAEGYTEEANTAAAALFPKSACLSADDCKAMQDKMAEDYAADGPWTVEVTCGATKLVAGFAALALASAM